MPPALIVLNMPEPPAETISWPPIEIWVPLATPPDRICTPAPPTERPWRTSPLATPPVETICVPEVSIVVPLSRPPSFTNSKPPLLTTPALARPLELTTLRTAEFDRDAQGQAAAEDELAGRR